MFTYDVYLKDDSSNERYSTARRNFNYDGQDCYIVLFNGQPRMIQSEYNFPYPAETIEEAAQAHIDALNAEGGE